MTDLTEVGQSETMKPQLASTCALLLLACGGSALDVGSNKGGAGNSEEGGRASEETGGSFASGGALATGGAAEAYGGQAMGAYPGVGGKMGTGTGGKDPMVGSGGAPCTDCTGGRPPVASGGSTGAAGAGGSPSNALVPQVCSTKLGQIWEGDTLDFFFNPQNDRWRLEFSGTDANGRLCGTATYLAAGQAPPPPATDPEQNYPPGYDPNFGKVIFDAWPGVTYSIIQGAEVGGAVHFRVAPNELWQSWCALQTPVPSGNGYSCVDTSRGWSSDGVTCTVTQPDGTTNQYSYAKCMLCAGPGSGVCACDSKECGAADSTDSIVFDLKVDGAQLTGTVGSKMIKFDLVQ